MYATQQHRVPPLCGPTLVHWPTFGGIPPKSPRMKHMFATTQGIRSLVPTTIVHWLNFGGIVCLCILTRTLDAYFLVPSRTMPTKKKHPFHNIRIHLLPSRTLHISQFVNLTPNRFQLSSLQSGYILLMTKKFQSSNTFLPWYIYIYMCWDSLKLWFLKTMFVIKKKWKILLEYFRSIVKNEMPKIHLKPMRFLHMV
jgi:hypothetical protein